VRVYILSVGVILPFKRVVIYTAQQTKPWYSSVTIWTNLVSILLIFLQYGIGTQLIPVEYQEVALAVFNLLNRLRTSTAVRL
jgi:hypothetical protein